MQTLPSDPLPAVTAYVAVTVDGRIALSADGKTDWTSKEDGDFLQGQLRECDAVVVGRRTYDAYAERLRARTTFVLTRRPYGSRRRGSVTFVNPAAIDIAAVLAPYRRVAVLGGAEAYGYMLERGLVGELFVTIEPLIFGRGREMVLGTGTARLELISCRQLNQAGSTLMRYRVIREQP